MLKLYRYWLVLFFVTILSACGGGSSLERGGDGGGGGDDTTATYTLSLSAEDSGGASSRVTSKDNPLTIKATLLANGSPAANRIVSFNAPVGVLNPESGNVLTGGDGIAEIMLNPGATGSEDSATLTASFTLDDISVSDSYAYTSLEDADGGISTGFNLTLTAVDTDGEPSRVTSKDTPLTVIATLTENGQAAVNKLISFSAPIGLFDPLSGNILTDSTGTAEITLNPGTSGSQDSSIITASFSEGDATLSQTYEFTSLEDGDTDNNNNAAITITGDFYKCPEGFTATLATINETNCTIKLGDNGANSIDSSEPIYLVVNLTTSSTNEAIADELIQASTSLALLNVDSTLSNSQGKALFSLSGNGQMNADALTVTAGDVSKEFNYIVATTATADSSGFPEYEIALSFLNVGDNQPAPQTDGSYLVTAENPLVVEATVTKDGEVITSDNPVLVTFTTTAGLLSPSAATSVTNENGIAKIILRAGSVPTAGAVQALVQVESGQVDSNQLLFQTAGDDVNVVSDRYKLDLRLVQKDTDDDIALISTSQQGELVATLTVAQTTGEPDVPVENAVINFTSTIGNLFPSLGTAITDQFGVASVAITPGDVKGAGQATASFENAQAFEFFESAGDEVKQDKEFTVNATVYDCTADGANKTNGTGCTEDNSVSLTQPRVLVISVTDNENPVADMLVSVSLDSGSLSPENGRVLTNSQGFAYVDINAGDGAGAGQLDIIIPSSPASGTTTRFVQIGTANIEMGNEVNGEFEAVVLPKEIDGVTDLASLAPGRTATLVVSIRDTETGNLYTDPLDVSFESVCASLQEPKAKIDNVVKTLNGVAKATYVADGCENQDQITATATAGTRSLTATGIIQLDDVPADSILFVSTEINDEVVTDSPVITFPGVGTEDKATLTFKVLDENNNPKAGQKVKFSLANDIGQTEGLSGVTLSPSEATSFTDGLVKVNVQSGRSASALVVLAELVDESDELVAYAVSRQIAATTGIADQDSITFAADTLNLESWGITGVENVISVYMSDHNNHPVVDGTSVVFRTEAGTIDSTCTTSNGSCSATWRSTNPVPLGYYLDNGFCDVGNDNDPSNDVAVNSKPCFGAVEDTNNDGVFDATDEQGPLQIAHPRTGRVTVLATAKGEETFVDSNSNGKYDSGETFYNLGEAFLDNNRDGAYCGQLDGSSDIPAPADPDTPFDIANIDFSVGVETSLCLRTASYGAQANQQYILLGAADEEFIDVNNNQTYDAETDSNNHEFNGLSCVIDDEEAGLCSRNLIDVRDEVEFVMSGQNPRLLILDKDDQELSTVYLIDLFEDCNGNGFWDASLDETAINLDCNNDGDMLDTDVAEVLTVDNDGDGVYDSSHSETVFIYITDINNNPMPSGTSVAFTTDNGEILGSPNSEFLESNSLYPTLFAVTVGPEKDGNEIFSGPLTITISTPNGVVTSSTVVNVIDRQ